MVLASKLVLHGAIVSPFWLFGSLFFLTIGELCLSPVGLSTMTKLAPDVIRGQIMGLWFSASALGNLMAGLIGGHVDAKSVEHLPELFMHSAIMLVIRAIVLFLLRAPIKKLIATTSPKQTEQNHLELL